MQTGANLKVSEAPSLPAPSASLRALIVPGPFSPAASGSPRLQRPASAQGLHSISHLWHDGPETKQRPQGQTPARQQPRYKIGCLSLTWVLDPIKTTCVFPFLPREGEIQACNNTVPLFSSGQKSKLESDKSEININFLIGLHGVWTWCQSPWYFTSYVIVGADRRNESFRRFKEKLVFP